MAAKVVVIGASAGGIDALRELVSGLPADFPTPICIVLHTSPQAPGVLDAIRRLLMDREPIEVKP